MHAIIAFAEGDGVRCELAGIRYEYNVLGTRGPRKMTALIPGTDAHSQNYIFRPETSNDGILDRLACLPCICCVTFLMNYLAFDELQLSKKSMKFHVVVLPLACVRLLWFCLECM